MLVNYLPLLNTLILLTFGFFLHGLNIYCCIGFGSVLSAFGGV